jgi:hypothetical protein
MRYNEIISEDIGNLAQLNVGSMINVLKQDWYSTKRGSEVRPDGKKFTQQDARHVNAESEIVDGGIIGATVADLRKAYRKAEAATGREVQAFALYIQGTAVAFGVYNLYTLGGTSREGKIAYDMTAFKDVLMKDYEDRQAAEPNSYNRNRISKPNLTSNSEEPARSWDTDKTPRKFTGKLKSTASLNDVFSQIDKLSFMVGQPVTCKLVVAGEDTGKKRTLRYSQKQITAGTEDLRTRLQRYKNSKKPTATDIHEFLKMVLTHEGKIVRFGGRAYVMKGSSYEKLDPMELLKGASFSVRYQSAEPNDYGSVEISYQFDVANNTIVPYKATWNERAEGEKHGSSQTAVLNAPMFTTKLLGVKKIDKAVIIPKLLTMLKSGTQNGSVEQAISALRQMGEDWPEFAIIEKSMAAEKAKKAA